MEIGAAVCTWCLLLKNVPVSGHIASCHHINPDAGLYYDHKLLLTLITVFNSLTGSSSFNTSNTVKNEQHNPPKPSGFPFSQLILHIMSDGGFHLNVSS